MKIRAFILLLTLVSFAAASTALAFKMPFFKGDKPQKISPKNGFLQIPLKDISDGKAHFYKVKADDGIMVTFGAALSKIP